MRGKRIFCSALLIAAVFLWIASPAVAAQNQPIVLTLGHFEPPDIQNTIEHPMAILAVFLTIIAVTFNLAGHPKFTKFFKIRTNIIWIL